MSPSPTSPSPDPLLQNALEAIENGMEDYTDGRSRRVSSALRNIYAGVLLLLKEKLRQDSPPGSDGSLIYKNLVPARLGGAIIMLRKGKATVDTEDIRARLSSLGCSIDWSRLETLRNLRNDVEHHHSKVPHGVIQQAIADAVVLLVEAFNLLGMVPAEALSEDVWAGMLNEAKAFQALEKACIDSRNQIADVPAVAASALQGWMICPDCGSRLLMASGAPYSEASFRCQACGTESELSAAMEVALEEHYGRAAYVAAKEGCEPPVAACPNCGSETFVLEDGVCLVCSEGLAYESCTLCGSSLSVDEQDFNGLCGYCSNRMSKDD